MHSLYFSLCIYLQGCVDDMIQDIVDCVQWIYDNIHSYGGQKVNFYIFGGTLKERFFN